MRINPRLVCLLTRKHKPVTVIDRATPISMSGTTLHMQVTKQHKECSRCRKVLSDE